MKGSKGMKHGAKAGSMKMPKAVLNTGETMAEKPGKAGRRHERGEGKMERKAEYGSPMGGMGMPSRTRGKRK